MTNTPKHGSAPWTTMAWRCTRTQPHRTGHETQPRREAPEEESPETDGLVEATDEAEITHVDHF